VTLLEDGKQKETLSKEPPRMKQTTLIPQNLRYRLLKALCFLIVFSMTLIFAHTGRADQRWDLSFQKAELKVSSMFNASEALKDLSQEPIPKEFTPEEKLFYKKKLAQLKADSDFLRKEAERLQKIIDDSKRKGQKSLRFFHRLEKLDEKYDTSALTTELAGLVNQQNRLSSLFSTMLQKLHETAMTVIRNM
jgi:hypothetical protein